MICQLNISDKFRSLNFDKRKKKILNYNQNKKKIYISPEYFINKQIQKGDVIGI